MWSARNLAARAPLTPKRCLQRQASLCSWWRDGRRPVEPENSRAGCPRGDTGAGDVTPCRASKGPIGRVTKRTIRGMN
jgi:hypothetical protein